MAVTTGKKIAEVYFEVKARTGKAAEELKKLHEAAERDLKDSRERLKANKEFLKLREKNVELSKKELADVAKQIKADKNATRESIDNLRKKVQEQEKSSKNYAKNAKKNLGIEEMMDGQIRRVWSSFTDWTGTQFDEQGKIRRRSQSAALTDYKGFLGRASREESRFANKLDQRDMTKNIIENARRGFAKGLLISEKWHRDENQLQRISRGLGIAGGSMEKIKSYSERAAEGFYKLQRVGFSLQSALSVIGSTLGSLVGAFLGLIGVAVQAGAAIVAVGSAFLSVAAGAIAAKIALGGVGKAVSALWDNQNGYNRALRDAKRALRDLRFEAEQAALSEEEAALGLERAREELARVQDLPPDSRARREVELQYQQAELAYRRAKARNKEARVNLKRGPLYGIGSQNPLKNLTESQKEFSKYLVSLKPQLMELREAAASGFLPLLQQGIANIVANAFPTFKKGLSTLSTAMGDATKSFSSALTTPENLKLLKEFFDSSAPIIRIFGNAAGAAFGGILAILKAAQPLTSRFAKWVEGVAFKFEGWAKSGANTTLKDFFNLAGDVASKLGTVFGKVFGGISNITKAAFPSGPESGAGGLIIKWLDKLATTFQKFTSGPDFGTWLKGSTDNALTALDTLGKFANIFVKLGSAPETKQFWLTIQGALPFLEKLVADGVKASPVLAEIIVQFVRMIAILSDSGTLETFFNVLSNILQAFNGLLEGIAPVLKIFGPLHGVVLAVTLALSWFLKGGVVLAGILEKITRAFGGLQSGMLRVASEAFTVKTRLDMLKTTYAGLSTQTIALQGPFAKLRAAINLTQRVAGTKKRSEMLIEMAKAAGAAKAQITQLRRELTIASKQGASTLTQLTRQSKTARALNLAGSGGRFGRGRSGMISGAVGSVGMAAGALTGGGGPISSGLGMASMVASFLPGPLGLISGAVLGIGSAIAGGFEAQAEATKQKAEAEKQKKIEIQAKLVEMRAENVNELKTSTQSLVGSGALATNVQGIIDKGIKDLQDQGIQGISDYQAAFQGILNAGFADVFAGNKESLKTGVLNAVGTVSKTGLYSPEEAAALLDPIFDAAGGGQAGLNAVNAYVKTKKFDQVQLYTNPTGGAELLPKGQAIAQTRNDLIQANAAAFYGPTVDALKEAVGALKTDILGTSGKMNNDIVLKALGMDMIQFNQKFVNASGYGYDTTKLAPILRAALSEQQAQLTGASAVPFGPGIAANGTSMINNGTFPGMRGTTGWRPPMAAQTDPAISAANTTANATASLANTTSNLASTIKTWAEKPTYVVLNTGKEVKDADIPTFLDKFVNTGGVSVRKLTGSGG